MNREIVIETTGKLEYSTLTKRQGYYDDTGRFYLHGFIKRYNKNGELARLYYIYSNNPNKCFGISYFKTLKWYNFHLI